MATTSVPASVIVPVVVMGPPDVVSPVVPPETSTEVTVPVPATVVHVMAAPTPPCEVRTCPAEPAVVGRLKFQVPAAAWGWMVTVPEVVPERPKVPVAVPANPSTGAALAVMVFAVSEARIVPATEVDG